MREHKCGTFQKREERINVITNLILVGQHHLLDESQNNNLGDKCFYQDVAERWKHILHLLILFLSHLFFFLQLTINMWVGCWVGTETWASVWSERWTSSGPPNSSRTSWTTGTLTKKHKEPLQRFHLVSLVDWFWLLFGIKLTMMRKYKSRLHCYCRSQVTQSHLVLQQEQKRVTSTCFTKSARNIRRYINNN